MRYGILVNEERCTGCWSCAMACKVAYNLAPDDWRIKIQTNGSGKWMDDPAGAFPNCSMSWTPVYSKQCVMCGPRAAAGELPYCVYNCPTHALTFGDLNDTESPLNQRVRELEGKGYELFEPALQSESRSGIEYIHKT